MTAELEAAYGHFEAARATLIAALEREAVRAGGAEAIRQEPRTRTVCGGKAMLTAQSIAEQYGVTVRRLMSKDRRHDIVCARQHLMATLYATGRYSLPAIGKFLGGRDHTTVLHGIRAHGKRMAMQERSEAA